MILTTRLSLRLRVRPDCPGGTESPGARIRSGPHPAPHEASVRPAGGAGNGLVVGGDHV